MGIIRLFFILMVSVFISCGKSEERVPKFLPYVDMSDWPLFDFKKTLFLKNYVLSFIDSDGERCVPTWYKYKEYSPDAFRDRVNFVKSLGGEVVISFGGHIQSKYTLENVCSKDELKEAYEKVFFAYGIKNFDFDIEGDALNNEKNLLKMFEVIKELQKEYGILVTLTMPVMPYGFEENAKRVLEIAKEKEVNIRAVNLMLMDYSEDYPADDEDKTLMFEYSKKAINSVNSYLKILWHNVYPLKRGEFFYKIGVIAMIGQNDIKNEFWYKSDFEKLIEYAKEKGLYLYSFWSLNRDKPFCDSCNVNNSTMLPKRLYGEGEFEFTNLGVYNEGISKNGR